MPKRAGTRSPSNPGTCGTATDTGPGRSIAPRRPWERGRATGRRRAGRRPRQRPGANGGCPSDSPRARSTSSTAVPAAANDNARVRLVTRSRRPSTCRRRLPPATSSTRPPSRRARPGSRATPHGGAPRGDPGRDAFQHRRSRAAPRPTGRPRGQPRRAPPAGRRGRARPPDLVHPAASPRPGAPASVSQPHVSAANTVSSSRSRRGPWMSRSARYGCMNGSVAAATTRRPRRTQSHRRRSRRRLCRATRRRRTAVRRARRRPGSSRTTGSAPPAPRRRPASGSSAPRRDRAVEAEEHERHPLGRHHLQVRRLVRPVRHEREEQARHERDAPVADAAPRTSRNMPSPTTRTSTGTAGCSRAPGSR